MNKLFKYCFAFIALLTLAVSCSEDEAIVDLYVEDIEVVTVGYNSIYCAGNVIGTCVSDIGICYSTSPNPTISDSCVGNTSSESDKFEATITGLEQATTYYIRVYAYACNGLEYGEQKSVTTYEEGSSYVSLVSVSDIGNTSATIESYVLIADSDVISRGICYSTTENPTVETATVLEKEGTIGIMTQTMEDLTDGEEYFVRAFVETQSGVTYSDKEGSFTTILYNMPTTAIVEFPAFDAYSIDVTYSVARDNELTISESGVYYSTSNDITSATKVANSSASGVGEFTQTISDLDHSTMYYFWSYAVNIKGESYSSASTMSTLSQLGAAEVSLFDNVLGFSADASIEITSLGISDAPITDAGVCFSKSNSTPTMADNYVSGGAAELGDVITMDLRTLAPSTTYYVVPYVTNEYGTYYGAAKSFTTRDHAYSYIRTYNDGSSLPYTNAIKYAPSYVDDSVLSDFHKEMYANVEAAVDDYGSGRIVEQLVFNFVEDENGDPILLLRLYYTNTSQSTTYQAYVYYKMEVGDDGVMSFPSRQDYSGNASTMYNSSNVTDVSRGYLDVLYDFLMEDDIIMDWGNATVDTSTSSYASQGVFNIYHKNDPEKSIRMSTYNYSYSSWTAITPWW